MEAAMKSRLAHLLRMASFFQDNDTVRLQACKFLGRAAGPGDLHGIDRGIFAETEVQHRVAVGIVSGLAEDHSGLLPSRGIEPDFRADGAAIGLSTYQLHIEPMIAGLAGVA